MVHNEGKTEGTRLFSRNWVVSELLSVLHGNQSGEADCKKVAGYVVCYNSADDLSFGSYGS